MTETPLDKASMETLLDKDIAKLGRLSKETLPYRGSRKAFLDRGTRVVVLNRVQGKF